MRRCVSSFLWAMSQGAGVSVGMNPFNLSNTKRSSSIRQHQPILRGRDEGRAGTAHPDSPRRQRDAADRPPGHERDPMRGRRKRRNRRNEGKRRSKTMRDAFRFGTPERPLPYGASGAGTRRLLSYPANRCAAEIPAQLRNAISRTETLTRHSLPRRLRHSDAQNCSRTRPTSRRSTVEAMLAEGAVSRNEAGKIRELLSGLFRSDRRIVVRRQLERRSQRTRHRGPGRAIDRRPDRVLTKGAEAVVIDYEPSQKTQPAYP